MSRPLFDGCEWNPRANRPSWDDEHHYETTPAEVIVGHKGDWRLCASCAALPRFNRYRVRTWIPAERQQKPPRRARRQADERTAAILRGRA